jgi:competence protein ComEC
MITFNKIPFVRVLLPFILGILGNLYLHINGPSFIVIICLIAFSSLFVFKGKQSRLIIVPLLVILDIALFLFGVELTKRSHLDQNENYFANKIEIKGPVFWIAQVNDIPVNKPRSIKMDLKVLGLRSDSDYVSCEGNVIAYFQKSSAARAMKPGNFVLIKSEFNEVGGPQNPYAFDFKQYLADKNIFHTSYVDSNSFALVPLQSSFSIWQFGLSIKHKIIERLNEVDLSPDARAICAALITGFDDDIDREVLDAFSHSGTLHVLSVSGLHVGLIYLVLNYLLGVVDRNKKYKLAQFLFISLCLWFFALITGFSAPVLRSVIMFNLLGLGNLYFRNKSFNHINILAVSAFVLLIIHPLWIRDIGFLLSYSALFGILYFHPKLSRLYEPNSNFAKKIWESVVVSFSATITTLPITLFVFHQFPIWFALANLIVVPLSFVLLLMAFAALLKIGFISSLVNGVTALMVWFISLFQTEGWSFIDHIDFNFTDAIGAGLVLFFLTALCVKRSYGYAFSLMSVMIAWQVLSLGDSYNAKTKNEIVIYQTHGGSTVSLKNTQVTVLNNFDTAQYSMTIKPNITSYNNTDRHVLSFNCLRNDNIELLILDRRDSIPPVKKGVTHVLVSNNAVPNRSFFEALRPKVLVVDGSNSYWAVRKLERLCEEFQISFHSTRDKGAFILPL